MKNDIEFRDLKPREIEVRVDEIRDNKCSLLLYKTARCDAIILDETVGNLNWQRKQYSVKNSLFSSILIYHNGEWIEKSDCGDCFGNFEKKKSESSDAFKRAGFAWGIGRELYTAPKIEIPLDKISVVHYGAEKEPPKIEDEFSVTKIHIFNKEIIGLEIKNKTTGEIVFRYGYLTRCPVCGEYMVPKQSKATGKIIKPEEILEKSGMCEKCYINNINCDEGQSERSPLNKTNATIAVLQYKDNVKKRPYEGTPLHKLSEQQLNKLAISNTITEDTKKAIQHILYILSNWR